MAEHSTTPSGGGLFAKLKASAQSAANQAQSIVAAQADRYHASQGTAETPYATKGSFSVGDLRQAAVSLNPSQSAFTLRIQQTIKAAKGVVSGHQSLSGQNKTFAKSLFIWAQEQETAHDLKDVSDRLAWMEFQQAEIQLAYAAKLEQARAALKDIRNFEDKLAPNRTRRQELQKRIDALQDKDADAVKVQAVQHELATLEANDEHYEASIRALKRQKLQEAFSLEFAAMKEMGEKLALLSGYGSALLGGLAEQESGAAYTGYDRTASIKSEAEKALAGYHGGLIPPPQLATSGSSLSRKGTTDSFGTTHAHELASLPTENYYPTPPARHAAVDAHTAPAAPAQPVHSVPPITTQHEPFEAPHVPKDPTVLETGVPIQGTNGPSEGQLPPRRPSNASSLPPTGITAPTSTPALPPRTKEEERQQEVEEAWQRANSGSNLAAGGSSGLGRSDTSMSRVGGQDLPAYSEADK